jgi:hypothetical protein
MAITRGGGCRVSVQFSPTGPGAKTAAIEFRAGTATKRANLSGTGIRGVTLSVTPASGDFGLVPVGTESEQKTFIVKNEGGIEGAAARWSRPSPTSRSRPTAATPRWPRTSTCELKVAFAPTAMACARSTWSSRPRSRVHGHADRNGVERPVVVTTPSSVDFGDIPIGRTASQCVVLRNPSDTALTALVLTPETPATPSPPTAARA